MCKNSIVFFLFLVLTGCSGIRNIATESAEYRQDLQNRRIELTETDVLNRSENGNWQLRIKGSPYELGYKKGLLTQDLYRNQEKVFFDKVAEMVSKPSRQKKLLSFLKWFNRDMLNEVPLEYKQEIYALSGFASHRFDDLGTGFERNMLLHSAHDIGHTMQDLMLVGCSSVVLWDDYSDDGRLLIGRNFDFYVNDAFAENKIVEFISPEKGYRYASVTWPGMVGVVSGMNEKGLTVTLNAGRSTIPLKGKTPVSIVARHILQYAQNLEEAQQLAQKFSVFVSESLLIGSSQDNRAVILEMSPKKFGVYETTNGKLICTNHFQSHAYEHDRRNREQIEKSHSYYRKAKLDELFSGDRKYSESDVVEALRDVSGLDGKNIGLGNEKALNQLMAHHAVIFKPSELKMWVSNSPYQLGAFDAYDLNTVFSTEGVKPVKELEFKVSDFVQSQDFRNYIRYRELDAVVARAVHNREVLPDEVLSGLEHSNPALWEVYNRLGDYFAEQGDLQKAVSMYGKALQKEISSVGSRRNIEKKWKKYKKRL